MSGRCVANAMPGLPLSASPAGPSGAQKRSIFTSSQYILTSVSLHCTAVGLAVRDERRHVLRTVRIAATVRAHTLRVLHSWHSPSGGR
jgi:hypothetical protein